MWHANFAGKVVAWIKQTYEPVRSAVICWALVPGWCWLDQGATWFVDWPPQQHIHEWLGALQALIGVQ